MSKLGPISMIMALSSLWSLFTIHAVPNRSRVGVAAYPTAACGPYIFPGKCHVTLHPDAPLASPHSNHPLPPVASPELIDAQPGFVPTRQLAALQTEYGIIQIFRLANTWVIIGSGQAATGSTMPPPASPGGPLVAVEYCQPSSMACLSPSRNHPLAGFTAVPLPATNISIALEDTFGNHLVIIGDGPHYGPIVLDTNNRRWYSAHVDIGRLNQNHAAYRPLTIGAAHAGILKPTDQALLGT